MRIGIDLDNTIVDYTSLFRELAVSLNYIPSNLKGGKSDIKKYILQQNQGQINWQKLQGKVYGPNMYKAKPYNGFKNFIERSLNNNDEIFIISHKTIYGHYDQTKTPLRRVAKKWLIDNRILNFNKKGILDNNIFFFSTRKNKIKKIEELQLDYFIDDLKEILNEIKTKDISKILFGNYNVKYKQIIEFENWDQISDYIYGILKKSEVKKLVKELIPFPIKKINKIDNGINSKVFKIECIRKKYVCKFYPNSTKDKRNRLKTEALALKTLKQIDCVPKIFTYNEEKNIAIFDLIEGKQISKVSNSHILQSVEFIKKLKNLTLSQINNLPNASESCLSACDIVNQIQSRLYNVEKNLSPELKSFLDKKLIPVFENSKYWLQKKWPSKNMNLVLEKKHQILSPSDFGFHNSILRSNGKICFIDFEYFGWDDPSKLINDFVWHPGMNLSEKHKEYWLKNSICAFSSDLNLKSRVVASWPLYGIRWSLIILKNFLYANDIYQEKNPSNIKKIENTMKIKLFKVENIIEKILINKYLCPYV